MVTFDTQGFLAAIYEVARQRGKNQEQVANEVGINPSTFTRMKRTGKICASANLAALSLWAGINPTKFSGLVLPNNHPSPADEELRQHSILRLQAGHWQAFTRVVASRGASMRIVLDRRGRERWECTVGRSTVQRMTAETALRGALHAEFKGAVPDTLDMPPAPPVPAPPPPPPPPPPEDSRQWFLLTVRGPQYGMQVELQRHDGTTTTGAFGDNGAYLGPWGEDPIEPKTNFKAWRPIIHNKEFK